MRRMVKRVTCSLREAENQNFTMTTPLRTSIGSNAGVCRMNSSYSCDVPKPIMCSTTARLQDRSNSTISRPLGRCAA